MNAEKLLKVILSPHMSEKAALGAEKRNSYVFQVHADTNKTEVKAAIEYLFNTKVDSVRIVNVKTKPKRFAGMEGRSKAWKKAYVTLQSGQQINLVEGQ